MLTEKILQQKLVLIMQCTISYSPCCNGTNAHFCRKYVLFGPFHLDIWTEKVESWQPLHESHKNYLSEGRSPVLMPTWGYYTKLSVMNWCIKNIEYWIFVLFLYLATPVFTKFCIITTTSTCNFDLLAIAFPQNCDSSINPHFRIFRCASIS